MQKKSLQRIPNLIALTAGLALSFWACVSASKPRTARDQNTASYQYELASVALKYGLEDEAVRYLEFGLTLEPEHQPSLFLLASLQLKKKDYVRAEENFRRSLALKPDDAEAHTRLGMVFRETGAHDRAEEEFLKAYSLNPNPTTALNLAQHFHDRGDLEQALDYVERARGQGPLSAPALNLRGAILSRLGRHAEAASAFEQALSLDGKNIVAAFNLAVTYIGLGRLGEARVLLEDLLPRVEDPDLRRKIVETLDAIK